MSDERTVIATHKITGAKLIWTAPEWFGPVTYISCIEGQIIAYNVAGDTAVVELKETQ
jgi:hypothetical protein